MIILKSVIWIEPRHSPPNCFASSVNWRYYTSSLRVQTVYVNSCATQRLNFKKPLIPYVSALCRVYNYNNPVSSVGINSVIWNSAREWMCLSAFTWKHKPVWVNWFVFICVSYRVKFLCLLYRPIIDSSVKIK